MWIGNKSYNVDMFHTDERKMIIKRNKLLGIFMVFNKVFNWFKGIHGHIFQQLPNKI